MPPFIGSLVAAFFAGAFLCNCIPHLAAGLQGRRFPTPLARFRGRKESSSMANFVWGTINIAWGATLVIHHPLNWGLNPAVLVFSLGWLLLGAYISRTFRHLYEPTSA